MVSVSVCRIWHRSNSRPSIFLHLIVSTPLWRKLDYSRFLVCTELMGSTPTTEDVKRTLRKSFEEYGKPERVLVDHGPQFRQKFKGFCEEEEIEVEQTPPHYPQIKGKIERFIRNFNEEYLVLQRVFTGVKEHFPEWVRDYNYDRPHMGIDNKVPADRYEPAKD